MKGLTKLTRSPENGEELQKARQGLNRMRKPDRGLETKTDDQTDLEFSEKLNHICKVAEA